MIACAKTDGCDVMARVRDNQEATSGRVWHSPDTTLRSLILSLSLSPLLVRVGNHFFLFILCPCRPVPRPVFQCSRRITVTSSLSLFYIEQDIWMCMCLASNNLVHSCTRGAYRPRCIHIYVYILEPNRATSVSFLSCNRSSHLPPHQSNLTPFALRGCFFLASTLCSAKLRIWRVHNTPNLPLVHLQPDFLIHILKALLRCAYFTLAFHLAQSRILFHHLFFYLSCWRYF